MTSDNQLQEFENIRDTSDDNCRILLDVLLQQGVEDVVISPGSRNTPLIIGAAARKSLRKRVIPDERTAAFTALGIAIVSKKPVALICTSGTALYNYAPAVAEAFYQKVPLIVISADRPAQWIDQDDSQTLRQFEALANIVKKSFNISPDAGVTQKCENPSFRNEREWNTNRIANEAFITSISNSPGPVHVNIQLAAPLNNTVEYKEPSERCISLIHPDCMLKPHVAKKFAEQWHDKKVLLVAGFLPPDDALNKAVRGFASLPNVAVMCETLSNLHLERNAYAVDSVLASLSPEQIKNLRPDVIISLGGALVSRMLKKFLREAEGAVHYSLGDTDMQSDCLQRIVAHIDIKPAHFLAKLAWEIRRVNLRKSTIHSDYSSAWETAKTEAISRMDCYINNCGWSELVAFREIMSQLPSSFNLMLSNGTSVRYAQILANSIPHACYGNRGVSGIDGTSATAYGISEAYSGHTVLITGDMSFAYCPEVMHLPGSKLHIVLINNNGGGIFRFISSTRSLPEREQYFCADQGLPMKELSDAYGWNYLMADNVVSLKKNLPILFNESRSLLEIRVPSDYSAEVLIKLFEWLKHPLDG